MTPDVVAVYDQLMAYASEAYPHMSIKEREAWLLGFYAALEMERPE